MDHLSTYQNLADAIAALLHPHAEVVVHDLASKTVAYIANPYSNRELGAPSLIDDVDLSDGKPVIGPYQKLNWDGRMLKSISVVMKDAQGAPEALFCINLDNTEISRLHQLLGTMLALPQAQDEAVESLFKDDWHDRINHAIQAWLRDEGMTLQSLTREDKRRLVMHLKDQGAFDGPGAAPYAAKCLGLGRATIYKYLKEAS